MQCNVCELSVSSGEEKLTKNLAVAVISFIAGSLLTGALLLNGAQDASRAWFLNQSLVMTAEIEMAARRHYSNNDFGAAKAALESNLYIRRSAALKSSPPWPMDTPVAALQLRLLSGVNFFDFAKQGIDSKEILDLYECAVVHLDERAQSDNKQSQERLASLESRNPKIQRERCSALGKAFLASK
jgi:hypothetical protein